MHSLNGDQSMVDRDAEPSHKRRRPESFGAAPFNTHPDLDELPEEFPVTIEINGHPVAQLLSTPSDLQELGIGWVFAQGFVTRQEEIRSVIPRAGRIAVMIDAPGPGGEAWQVILGSGFDARHLRPAQLTELGLAPLTEGERAWKWTIQRVDFLAMVTSVFEAFREERGVGGYHHAATIDGNRISKLMRDVSRHNAVDKAVGWNILHRTDRARQVLCLSGRVTADLVVKAWRAGFPAIATRSLPTGEAVELAEIAGISIVGRVLDQRRSIYTNVWRLSDEKDSD
jgi:FdhD protein